MIQEQSHFVQKKTKNNSSLNTSNNKIRVDTSSSITSKEDQKNRDNSKNKQEKTNNYIYSDDIDMKEYYEVSRQRVNIKQYIQSISDDEGNDNKSFKQKKVSD